MTSRASPASRRVGRRAGGSPMYEESRRLYTEEINAAVRGAKAAGATEIVVMDCHGAGEEWTFNSLIPELLDEACDFVVQDEWTEYTAFLESGRRRGALRRHARDGRHAARRDEPHRLGPGVAEPLVQRRARRGDRDQRRALRHLGLPGADGHRRRCRLRRGARAARAGARHRRRQAGARIAVGPQHRTAASAGR